MLRYKQLIVTAFYIEYRHIGKVDLDIAKKNKTNFTLAQFNTKQCWNDIESLSEGGVC